MDDNIVRGIFSLLVAAIAGLMGYSSAIRAIVRKDQNAAALEFQSIFQRTLFKIDPRYKPDGVKVDVIDILDRDFEGHALAVMKFKQFIPEERAVELETAWTNYHGCEVAEGHYWYRYFLKYQPSYGDPRINIDTDSIIKNINLILTFAKLNHKSPFDPVETENR